VNTESLGVMIEQFANYWRFSHEPERLFVRKFKLAAVKMVVEQGLNLREGAKGLG
jgi:hypothetical protein